MANTLLSPIIILPASPSDYYSLALLEGTVFSPEEFSQVAFGPQQLSHGNLCSREKKLASQPKEKGSRNVVMKAVITEGEKERIVGCSGWTFALGREGNVGAIELGEKVVEEEAKDVEGKGEEGGGWGTGANVKFCEDVFLTAEKHMMRSTESKNYAKLNTLVVHPEYQRRGIGKMLMEDGLKEADRLGIQAVLGASKEGLGLYKKYGFTEFETMEINLWEYEGGEGMGTDRHVVMHRPAQNTID